MPFQLAAVPAFADKQAGFRHMDESAHILLMRLRSLGDIVFTLPAVHQVRAAFPKARLAFLTSKEYVPLLQGFREVDEVMALDRDKFRRFRPAAVLREVFTVLRNLRRPGFSLAVDFQGYGETALLAWCSGAPQRWGMVYARGRKWAYTHGVRRDGGLHPVEANLRLVEQAGPSTGPRRNRFILPDQAAEEARRLFVNLGLDPTRPTLFFQPFTSSPQKNWPLDRFLECGRYWRERGYQVLFGGGPGDKAALAPAREAGFPVAAGAPLLVSAGLARLSTVVLGGDTGLLHLAVAMGKRVVMLMNALGPGASPPYEHSEWAVLPVPSSALSAVPVHAVNEALARGVAALEA
jgi:ADP-heptose:LPS heptosyltransferase